MARTVGIGIQSFEKLAAGQYFYVDKTGFIKTWWENGDEVTLITRPRRFGKTLTMSMVEQFFSVKYADRGALFEGLSIWQEEKYRRLQGAYPVISLGRYCITSNRESGFGRYDVMLEPKKKEDDAIIIEFKAFNARKEKTLEDTVRAALVQIEKKEYGTPLLAKGIPAGHIRKYGFAFEGKTVLIGE